MFEADLAEYREKGAEALKGKLDGLVSRALDESATENFRHFVADLCMDLKDYQRALEVLLANDKAGALTDVGYNNMALCYWELGREEDAYFAYKKSLAINSENVSSLRGACYLAIEKGHVRKLLISADHFTRLHRTTARLLSGMPRLCTMQTKVRSSGSSWSDGRGNSDAIQNWKASNCL